MPDRTVAMPRAVTPTTILAEELRAICSALDDAADIDSALRARAHRARDIAVGLDPYLDDSTTPESPALADLARRTREADWGSGTLEQEMLSGHVEGQTLKFLIRLSGAKRVLEIGMFTGYSALAMAEALPVGGEVVACEVDADVARFARECFDRSPAGAAITIEVGPALDTLRGLAGRSEPFDFVFVDADKSGYWGYVDFLLTSDLVAPGGIIAVDNTLMQGDPWAADGPSTVNGNAIADFNRTVAQDDRVEQVVIPLRDGLTLIRRTERS